MIGLVARLAGYWAARRFGTRAPLPFSLTVSLLNDCNARCSTCRIYDRQVGPLLSVAEYERIFASIGPAARWVTLTGGEPTLRADLGDIVAALDRRVHPRIITLPTNGLLPDRAESLVSTILRVFRGTLVVNVSLDAVGAEHDRIRGVPGAWDKAAETLRRLKALRETGRLVVGVHTVLSRFNVHTFADTCEALLALEPDSMITEIAEHRVELGTQAMNLAPSAQDYRSAIEQLERRLKARRARGWPALVQAMRSHYYVGVQRLLEGKDSGWSCYAALMSAQLTPDGKVWACCVRGEELGDLRAAGYDFVRVWRGARAGRVRQEIAASECQCSLANAAYTNVLVSPKSVLDVGRRLARQIVESFGGPRI